MGSSILCDWRYIIEMDYVFNLDILGVYFERGDFMYSENMNLYVYNKFIVIILILNLSRIVHIVKFGVT